MFRTYRRSRSGHATATSRKHCSPQWSHITVSFLCFFSPPSFALAGTSSSGTSASSFFLAVTSSSFVAALTFLTMCDRLQWGGTFYVYAALSAFALLFFALLVPETTGLPLEEISPLFDAPRELVRRNLAALGVLRAAARK